jgi:hypothetical protein
MKQEMDVSEINAKVQAFERLAAAVERAVAALEKLDDIKHGGLKIEMVGDVMTCKVEPVIGPETGRMIQAGPNRGYKTL